MRIIILYDKSGSIDEGMKCVGYNLSKELARNNEICEIDLNRYASPIFWNRIKDFSPHIIHFVPGITIKSIFLLKILRSLYDVKTTITALVPRLNQPVGLYILKALQPDRIFILSSKFEDIFRSINLPTKFLPMGVDIERFKPEISQEQKFLNKKELGLNEKQFTVLHIGHLQKGRNIEILSDLVKLGYQGVLIATTSTKPDLTLQAKLEKEGVVIIRRYFKNIECIYRLADCYVFPTLDNRNAVNIPLSVLEAMACNLPVVSTHFGGLPRMFNEGNGVLYADTKEKFLKCIKRIEKGEIGKIATRKKVSKYNWHYVARLFEEYLNEVLGK